MKAVVFHGLGDIRVDDVPEPTIEAPTDAVIRITTSAICGTDLHFVRGSFSGMEPGTILGHEGVGIVEQIGDHVRNFAPGDRVVVCSTIACGSCSYCRSGYFAQCDNANPHGKRAGTAFFGGPGPTGPWNGLQAEKARIPYAHTTLVKLPDAVTDDQAILTSDIFPTGWFGAEMAEIEDGHTVAVFGCGPVGQFAIASARLMGAGRILAVDHHPDRLERVSHWPGDEQESDAAHGQLSSPQVHPPPPRPDRGGHDRPADAADRGAADAGRDQRLRGFRCAPARLAEGGTEAGGRMSRRMHEQRYTVEYIAAFALRADDGMLS